MDQSIEILRAKLAEVNERALEAQMVLDECRQETIKLLEEIVALEEIED